MFNTFVWNAVVWLPTVFYWALFVAAVLLYMFRNDERVVLKSKLINYKSLIIAAISFRFGYAILQAIGRYYIWTTNAFSQALINSPLSKDVPENFVTNLFHGWLKTDLGYFLYYSYIHYFLNPILVVACAFLFYFILKALQKYQARFFDTGETELGFLCALIVGWAGFVLFVPFAFVAVVLVSIFRGIVFKEPYTTLGWPFIIAAFACLLASDSLITMLGLGVLRINNAL